MMPIQEIEILVEASPGKLDEEANKRAEAGYTVQGGIACAVAVNSLGFMETRYALCMTRTRPIADGRAG